MFRRGRRIAQILHGEALAECGLPADPRYDMRLVDHQLVYLVDDSQPRLAAEPVCLCLRYSHGSRPGQFRGGKG